MAALPWRLILGTNACLLRMLSFNSSISIPLGKVQYNTIQYSTAPRTIIYSSQEVKRLAVKRHPIASHPFFHTVPLPPQPTPTTLNSSLIHTPTNSPSSHRGDFQPRRLLGNYTAGISSASSHYAPHAPNTTQFMAHTRVILKSLSTPRPFPPSIHRLRICVGRV